MAQVVIRFVDAVLVAQAPLHRMYTCDGSDRHDAFSRTSRQGSRCGTGGARNEAPSPRMRNLIVGAGLLLGAAAVVNKLLAMKAGGLESRLEGRSRFYHWRYQEDIHNVFYKSIGEGPPILLVHSIHAAASSFEMRKIHSELADQFTVYTLDLLGFGLSDRPAVHYDAELYITLIHDFVRDVIREPTSVLASSLSAAHVIENAARNPKSFETLIMVAPTGLELATASPSTAGRLRYWIFRFPIVGSSLFNLLTRRAAIERWLEEEALFDPSQASAEAVEEHYTSCHQENARFAPAAAYTGRLNLGVEESYRSLARPVLVAWGREARWATVDQSAAFRSMNANARLRVFDRCGILVHDECAEELAQALKEYFKRAPGKTEEVQTNATKSMELSRGGLK